MPETLAQWIIPTVIVRNLKATALGISLIALNVSPILSQHKPVLTFPYFVEGDGWRVQLALHSFGDDATVNVTPDYSSRKHKMSKRARHVESDQRVTGYPQKTDGIRPG